MTDPEKPPVPSPQWTARDRRLAWLIIGIPAVGFAALVVSVALDPPKRTTPDTRVAHPSGPYIVAEIDRSPAAQRARSEIIADYVHLIVKVEEGIPEAWVHVRPGFRSLDYDHKVRMAHTLFESYLTGWSNQTLYIVDSRDRSLIAGYTLERGLILR